MTDAPGARVRFSALGTTALLWVTRSSAVTSALSVLKSELEAIELSCSRFRADSELSRLNRAGGETIAVSGLFATALSAALRAARLTDGAVDPTVGAALRLAGYDTDFALVSSRSHEPTVVRGPVVGWQAVELDVTARTVRVPPEAELDLGATAKALACDRAARKAAAAGGSGTLVSLGGDVAVAGHAPEGGWPIQLADDHGTDPGPGAEAVCISSGGLATSGTAVRRWIAGDREQHHIIDPGTSHPAVSVWKTVSVVAGCCVDANIASTASIVRGEAAPEWLEERSLPGRLVAVDGDITYTNGWPRRGV